MNEDPNRSAGYAPAGNPSAAEHPDGAARLPASAEVRAQRNGTNSMESVIRRTGCVPHAQRPCSCPGYDSPGLGQLCACPGCRLPGLAVLGACPGCSFPGLGQLCACPGCTFPGLAQLCACPGYSFPVLAVSGACLSYSFPGLAQLCACPGYSFPGLHSRAPGPATTVQGSCGCAPAPATMRRGRCPSETDLLSCTVGVREVGWGDLDNPAPPGAQRSQVSWHRSCSFCFCSISVVPASRFGCFRLTAEARTLPWCTADGCRSARR
jgi:hypothetical protein